MEQSDASVAIETTGKILGELYPEIMSSIKSAIGMAISECKTATAVSINIKHAHKGALLSFLRYRGFRCEFRSAMVLIVDWYRDEEGRT